MRSEIGFALPMRTGAFLLGAMLVVASAFATTGTAEAKAGKGSSFAALVTSELEDGGTFKGKIIKPEVAPDASGEGLTMSGVFKG